MAMAVPIVVMLGWRFGFGVTQHDGLHQLAQGVFVEGHMAGQEAGQARHDQ